MVIKKLLGFLVFAFDKVMEVTGRAIGQPDDAIKEMQEHGIKMEYIEI
jgi:hypothetical protein